MTDRKGLEIILDRHGFRVEAMTTEASFYTLGYLSKRTRKTIFGTRGLPPGLTWGDSPSNHEMPSHPAFSTGRVRKLGCQFPPPEHSC